MISCEEEIFNEVRETLFLDCGLDELFYQEEFCLEEAMEIILDSLRSYMGPKLKNVKSSARGKISKNKEMEALMNQAMCEKDVDEYPSCLKYTPDQFKTQQMCDKAVDKYPGSFAYVPNHFKSQEMCDKAVYRYPNTLKYVPDQFKTK